MNGYEDAIILWEKLSRKSSPNTGSYNTILQKKFSKSELYDVTRDPEYWIIEI